MSVFTAVSAQRNIFEDSTQLKNVTDFFVDDYQNVYLYKKANFSLTKFDSLGMQKGRQLLTLPFKVQGVQNPMNIVLFSENVQEVRFLDQNLNNVQTIDLKKFGFVKMAYAEDQQQIWLLDESERRLVQYDFRADKVLNSYSFNIEFEDIRDMMVFDRKLYLLRKSVLEIYNLRAETIARFGLTEGLKMRRENELFYVITGKNIMMFRSGADPEVVFGSNSDGIVEKNSNSFFEISGDKLYLYPIAK